jgi:hypothetical protein
MATGVNPLATSVANVIYTDLNWLVYNKLNPVIMFVLSLAVGNMNVAHRITVYSSNTRHRHARCNFGKYKGRLLYLPNKKRQPIIFYTSFLSDVSRYFYTPNIILPI